MKLLFFSTISNRLRSEDSETHDVANFDLKSLKGYADSKVPRDVEFKIPFMKLSDLVNAIESHDIKKSTGAAKVISPTLLEMINISINTGNFS